MAPPASISQEIKEKRLGALAPVEALGRFITDIQNLNAYRAKQFFPRNNNCCRSIFGNYKLSEDCVTVLQLKPSLEFDNLNIVEPENIKYWEMKLVSFTSDEKGNETPKTLSILEYNYFIKHLM